MSAFPPAFAALEPYASWALPLERDRQEKKGLSSKAEAQAFYDAFLPLLPVALDHLNTFALGAMPPAERRLLDLCFGLVEATSVVEMFHEVNPRYLIAANRFVPMHDEW